MVLCKFYLQGRCRFGDECRFEHTDSSSSYYGHGSQPTYVPQGDRYHYVKPQLSSQGNAPTNEPKPISQILEIVNQDMIAADKGGQWPFSSYAPAKEYGVIIGLDDISPEELRWQMYIAMQTGTIEECKREFQELLQTAVMKRNLLMSQSPDAYSIVQSIYHSKDLTGHVAQNQSEFQFAPGIFGGTTPGNYTTNTFGGSTVATAPNIFTGQTSSIFGGSSTSAQPPSGLFGAAAAAATNQSTASLFGTAPAQPPSGLFGSAAASLQSSSSLFGAVPSQSQGLFGASPAASPVSLFGNSSPPSGLFGAAAASLQPSGSIFGAGPVQSPSVFGSAPTLQSPSLFGAVATPHPLNIFGSSSVTQQSNVFGASSNTTSIFGQPSVVENSSQQPSFFQNSTSTFNSGDANSLKDGVLYTPIAELSEEDLSAFKAKTFTMGHVPIRAPPQELCC